MVFWWQMLPCFVICYRDFHVVANICYCHKLVVSCLCNVCNAFAIIYTTQDDCGVKMYIQCCYHKISFATWVRMHDIPIGLYRENAIAVRVLDRSAYDATSRVHAHRQRKNLSYLRNGCCIYYLRPSGSAHL